MANQVNNCAQITLGEAARLLALMTLREVAQLLRISPHTVRAMVRDGRLRPVRICRRLLFSQQEVARLLDSASARRPVTAEQVESLHARRIG